MLPIVQVEVPVEPYVHLTTWCIDDNYGYIILPDETFHGDATEAFLHNQIPVMVWFFNLFYFIETYLTRMAPHPEVVLRRSSHIQ